MAAVVSLCVLLLLATQLTVINCELCATPASEEGECVDINECETILVLYNNLTSVDKQTRKFLHKSQCGYAGLTPKVCCPKSSKPLVLQHPITPDLGSRFGDTEEEKLVKGECGIQYTTERIFDGTITEIDEFPWMALLIYQTEQGPGLACGGVLINNKYVLTAAHCVIGAQVEKLGKLIAVRLGEYDLQTPVDCDDTTDEIEENCAPPANDIFIESSHPHPNYKAGTADRHHDIALIRLSNPANFTKYVQPICLPNLLHDSSISESKKNLVICGWGKTEKSEGSAIKLKAKVPLVEENECKNPYEAKGIRIAKTQLCAGDGKHDSCKGDSGGPLMLEDLSDSTESRWYAVGIISFGSNPCAKQGVPAVYTRVFPYLDWIKSTMKP